MFQYFILLSPFAIFEKDKRTDLKLTGMKNLSFCSSVQY